MTRLEAAQAAVIEAVTVHGYEVLSSATMQSAATNIVELHYTIIRGGRFDGPYLCDWAAYQRICKENGVK